MRFLYFFLIYCRHYQRRRNNGHQWSDCVRSGYDVLGECAAGGAIAQHDDAVSPVTVYLLFLSPLLSHSLQLPVVCLSASHVRQTSVDLNAAAKCDHFAVCNTNSP